jgi:hypothetical protein
MFANMFQSTLDIVQKKNDDLFSNENATSVDVVIPNTSTSMSTHTNTTNGPDRTPPIPYSTNASFNTPLFYKDEHPSILPLNLVYQRSKSLNDLQPWNPTTTTTTASSTTSNSRNNPRHSHPNKMLKSKKSNHSIVIQNDLESFAYDDTTSSLLDDDKEQQVLTRKSVIPATNVIQDDNGDVICHRNKPRRRYSDPLGIGITSDDTWIRYNELMSCQNDDHGVKDYDDESLEESLVQYLPSEQEEEINDGDNFDGDGDSETNHPCNRNESLSVAVADLLQTYNILPLTMDELYDYLKEEQIQEDCKMYKKRTRTVSAVSPSSGFETQNTHSVTPSKYSFGTQFFQSWTGKKSHVSTFVEQDTPEDVQNNTSVKHPIMDKTEACDDSPSKDGESKVHSSLHVFVENDIPTCPAKQEAFLLFFLFRKFSSPSPSYDSVRVLLEKERCGNPFTDDYMVPPEDIQYVDLPQDAIVNIGTSSVESVFKDDPRPLVPQMLSDKVFFKFPLYFQRAFLRILIRILTSESDEEYDRQLRYSSRSHYETHRKGHTPKGANANRRSSFPGKIPKDSRFCNFLSRTGEDLDVSQDTLYSVVRFRFDEAKGKSLVDNILNMINFMVHSSQIRFDEVEEKAIVTSLCRLLGLVSSAGVTPMQLRTMFQWISETSSHTFAHVHILRSLIVATEASSVANKFRGKASPKSFFCFGRSGGISHMIYPHLNSTISGGWPFKNVFSFACWFRIEGFPKVEKDPVLFKIQSGDGTCFDISFRTLQTSENGNSVATLVYSVHDSNKHSRLSSRAYELHSCPIVPRVWFHIAIRHSKKSYLSLQKDELAIFIDGKLIEKKSMMFPICTTTATNSALNLNHSRHAPPQPIKIDCFSHIDAEAGPLYVFNGILTDATLRSLYEYTSGTIDSERSLKDNGDSHHQDDLDILKQADINEIVIPQSKYASSQTININNSEMNAIDLIGDDGFCSDIHRPIKGEFSRSTFISNIFLVWDPSRISDDGFILEAHSKIHPIFDVKNNSSWSTKSLKDVIRSIGGVQSLLPLMKSMIIPSISAKILIDDWDIFSSQKIVSLCFYLLSSFLRDSDINGREFLRCGGTDIVSDFIHESKLRYADAISGGKLSDRLTFINAFRWNHYAAEDLTSSLMTLDKACLSNPILRVKILSRIICNVELWFGGLNDIPGVAFHALFLPTLSVLAKIESHLLTDIIRVSSFINFIRELTIISSNEDGVDNHCFHEITRQTKLTSSERKHLVDIAFGIIFSIMRVKVSSKQLLPLLQFISFHLDIEWEAYNAKDANFRCTNMSKGSHIQRFMASEKACTLLTLLFQTRPFIPGLFDSLNQCLGDTASWILCCMVNSYDDKLRSDGIQCFVAFYDALLQEESTENDSSFAKQIFGVKTKAVQTFKNVGTGLGVIPRDFDTSPKSVGVAYKLLWYILKSHRHHLGHLSYNALLHVLIKKDTTVDSVVAFDDSFVVEDSILPFGYLCNNSLIALSNKNVQIDGQEWSLRNNFATSAILELLRFLPAKEQEIWLFDLLTLVRVSPSCKNNFLDSIEWQHCLFHVASDTVEELCSFNMSCLQDEKGSSDEENSHDMRQRNIYARFDLIFEFYAMLLAYSFRNDDMSISCIEQAAALQRVSLNGTVVFSVLLSHILADIIQFGTMAQDKIGQTPDKEIRKCAKHFFEMDLSNAAAHWKKIRHLTTVCVAIVTNNGFGLADLFDYKNNLSAKIDGPSGGLFGIHLNDDTVTGITAVQIVGFSRLTQRKDGSNSAHDRDRDLKRRVSTSIAAQLLEMIDPYVFPDSLDIEGSPDTHQIVWHTLLRSAGPFFGDIEGPLLFSLIRLVLIVIAYLEPSSSKFLKCCYLLRCFQRWSMDMINEPDSDVDGRFQSQHLVLDRLIICIILQCHRTLYRCCSALQELEAGTCDDYAVDDVKQTRRLYKSIKVLGDVVFDIFETRCDALQTSLSQNSYDALTLAFSAKEGWNRDKKINSPQEGPIEDLREFLNSYWIQHFHDNDYAKETKSDICFAIPELLRSSTIGLERGRKGNGRGFIIMKELSEEAIRICNEFNNMLNEPFQKYLSARMKWTDSTAVRDLEYCGNLSITNLSSQYRQGIKELRRSETMHSNVIKQRYRTIQKKIDTDTAKYHWKLARHPDTLHRRILLVPNRNFDDHVTASYDLTLGIDREKAFMDREGRLHSRNDDDLLKMVKIAKEGIVKQNDVGSEETLDDVTENDFLYTDDDIVEPIGDKITPGKGEPITDWDQFEDDNALETNDKNDNNKKGSHEWAKEFIWTPSEKLIQLFEDVQIVTVDAVVEGQIVLSTHNLYFRPTNDPINVVTKEKADSKGNQVIFDDGRWRLSRLQQVHGRRFMLRSQAIELFFADTHQLFLNFCTGPKIRDRFIEKLRLCKTPLLTDIPRSLNPRVLFKKRFTSLTESWKERKISNFEYLMELNIIAGRTFSDISQYPVFPWVIADFESETLDLNDVSTFRDLSKPVGALNPDRLAQLIDRYHDLDGLPEEEKFLYGSHYSSPGVVLHYLIRQEPFTTMAIDLQSGRFDCPDRLFYNIGACWKSCLNSTSDVKELVPELFTCPELFLNTNNFPLGETQSRTSISNVILPPWANGSAYEFIRLHRLALESEYVSSNLHHWIDLIFGYKQRGAEAVKANNVFHFLSYEGSVDLDKITDEIDRAATESQIQNFGQVPSQLLCEEPHPQRYPRDRCWMPIISELTSVRRLTCFTPVKQFNGSRNPGKHGPALRIHVLPDNVVVIYADLSVGMYKWSPTKHGKAPFYLRMDKMRPIVTREMTISSFAMGLRGDERNNCNKIQSRGIGNWSFAMTINNSISTKASKSVGLKKNKDVPSSTFDVTLLSCGYCDYSLKAHTLDGLRLKSSETGGHLGQINCICLGEDGTLLVTGGVDATCRVWTIDNPNMAVALIDSYVQTAQGPIQSSKSLICCLVLWGHGSPITSLACSSALDIVVSGSEKGTICIHTMRRGTFIRIINACEYVPSEFLSSTEVAIRNIALHSDGVFVTHLESGLLQMYTINGVKLSCVDCGEKLNAMEMIPGGHALVTGGESGHVIIRSLRNLEIQYVLDLSDYGPISCISFTPPPSQSTKSIHQFMFVGTFDGSITVVCAEREDEPQDNQGGDGSNDDFNTDVQRGQSKYVQHYSTNIQELNHSWWNRRIVNRAGSSK